MKSALKKKKNYTCISRSKSVKPEARFSTGRKGKQDSTEDTNISRSLSMKSALKDKTAIHAYLVLKREARCTLFHREQMKTIKTALKTKIFRDLKLEKRAENRQLYMYISF